MCAGEDERDQESVRFQASLITHPKEITMKKFSRIAIAASFAVLAVTQAYAEEYHGVLQFQSTQSRSEVRAQAVAAAHAANPYSDAASSVVAAAPTAPRDRAAVLAEARARAHAPNQNLRIEAFAGSRVPAYYDIDRASSTRLTRVEGGTTLR
ncbi:hypothetical protein SAMN05444679_101374 [Variovorax sp. CF079]|nr:hypothetical protein SAMN05444679_101374 [Variovorax sp. CF079]